MKTAVRKILEENPTMDPLKRKKLESDLNIWEWGRWMGGGWPTGRSGAGTTPNITDEDALRLNKLVTALPDLVRYVIVETYIYRKGMAELESELHASNRVIMGFRDQGLNLMHGAIFLSKIINIKER